MLGFLRHDRMIHEIDIEQSSNLYSLLSALIAAYNRRTDVMERVIKLDERLQAMTGKLDAVGEKLRSAVDKNRSKTK